MFYKIKKRNNNTKIKKFNWNKNIYNAKDFILLDLGIIG